MEGFVAVVFGASVVVHFGRSSHHVLLHFDPLSSTFAAEGVFERFVRQQTAVVFPGLGLFGDVFQQSHGECLSFDDDAVGVCHGLSHFFAKFVEFGGIDHAGVAEPATIGGDSAGGFGWNNCKKRERNVVSCMSVQKVAGKRVLT